MAAEKWVPVSADVWSIGSPWERCFQPGGCEVTPPAQQSALGSSESRSPALFRTQFTSGLPCGRPWEGLSCPGEGGSHQFALMAEQRAEASARAR